MNYNRSLLSTSGLSHFYLKSGNNIGMKKGGFTGTFVCSVISDNFLMVIRKQPVLEVHSTSGLTHAKCGLAHFDT